MTRFPKKLIEVALPLDAINKVSAREKRGMRSGRPSTLHQWWARRPLASARAVIFSQLVDDPAEYVKELLEDPEKRSAAERAMKETDRESINEVIVEQERKRLFNLIETMIQWENNNNEKVLKPARDEIEKSWRRTCQRNADHPRAEELFNPEQLPTFHDPFAGGGTLPLEAQRLGLKSYASDLNPVAVLINKAMIELPPKFANRPPVRPESAPPQGEQVNDLQVIS